MSKPTKTTILRDPGELLAEDQEKESRVSSDELKNKLQDAEDAIRDLERRKEDIDRQRKQLEELRRKQSEFEGGQHEILEKLTRGLVLLERQEFELKRDAEQIQIIRKQFAEQLYAVQQIEAHHWETTNLDDELTRALATVDQARSVYVQAQARLEAVRRQSGQIDPEDSNQEESLPGMDPNSDFAARVAAGFAYSLPGLVGLFLLTILWMILKR